MPGHAIARMRTQQADAEPAQCPCGVGSPATGLFKGTTGGHSARDALLARRDQVHDMQQAGRKLLQEPVCLFAVASEQRFTEALQASRCDRIVIQLQQNVSSSAAIVTSHANRVTIVAGTPQARPPQLQVRTCLACAHNTALHTWGCGHLHCCTQPA